MAGILDTIAAEVFKGFKGKLLTGTLKRVSPVESGGLDRFGDPIDQSVTTWTCEGFVDLSAKGFKGQDRVPKGDATVYIFGRSLSGGSVRPELDDKVQFGGDWYQLRSEIRTDPATALWECRADRVQA